MRASAWLLAVGLGGLLGVGDAHAAVAVTVEPPAVAYVEFDSREPPAEMPSGGAVGGGLCHAVFEIESDVVSSIEMLTPTWVRAYPANFAIVARLRITIYTPRNARQEMRAHEEGHRTIAEHFYGNAQAAAYAAAAAVQARTFEADGIDRGAAEQAVGTLVRAALKDEFMQRTQVRSAAANKRYDAITNNGRDPIAATEAAAAAIAQDP